MRKGLFIGLGVLLVLAVGVGLVFASDSSPTKEPDSSPYFEATLQQAVNELDGQARSSAVGSAQAPAAVAPAFTQSPDLYPECFTRDLANFPWCHYTTDPILWPEACKDPYPTQDYTWQSDVWDECEPPITQDPAVFWCDPMFTNDPSIPICQPNYTQDPTGAPSSCLPLYTWDYVQYPDCPKQDEPDYTYAAALGPQCDPADFTKDVTRWRACHYTSDALNFPECEGPIPTQDYTSSPGAWPECPGPEYTEAFQLYPWCDPNLTQDPLGAVCTPYTQDVDKWPWCMSPNYTTDVFELSRCHYTSDPDFWDECEPPYPTVDYTEDSLVWKECEAYTRDPAWLCDPEYTYDFTRYPWCNPQWTWDSGQWPACAPGYTYNPGAPPDDCEQGPTFTPNEPDCDPGVTYTADKNVWPECENYTADSSIWPECQFTADPLKSDCGDSMSYPTMDYTTDLQWIECVEEKLGDLGDAPDSTNHFAVPMLAFPATPARYPTVFDAATGLPQGPKHWYPRADSWLGKWVTVENDADLMPDEDGVLNIAPPATPDKDKRDDGVKIPLPAPLCAPTTFTYTVTISPGAFVVDRYVNVWFDWTRDGDWEDVPECPDGAKAPEWAVKNQLLPGLGPGTYVFVTPVYLPWQPPGANILDTWMRISIAERPAPKNTMTGLADGRGPANGYRIGETEDYFFKPTCPKPVADFHWDPLTICPTTTVFFFDDSTGSPTSWSWDFDGLGNSNLQNPSFVFGSAGTYNVSLTVSNACGSDTVRKPVEVIDCPDQDPDYDIYIKDSDADDGSVPSSAPYWRSPDIWVRNDLTDDCEVETTHQNPIPGLQNKICVRVRNRMTETVDDTTVNVYWANAALGLLWPGSYSYIGNFTIASIAGGAQEIGSVVWDTPYSIGHYCLLVRADAPNDPLATGPDTVPDVNKTYNNNNIAQKNLNVVNYPEIKECGFYSSTVYTEVVYFDAVNTTDAATDVDIEIDSDDFPLGAGTIMLDPGSMWEQWDSLSGFSQGADDLTVVSFPASINGASLAAYETVHMTLTIAAEVDERFTIDVGQQVDGETVGGIDYERELPMCYYLPIILRLYEQP